MYYSVTQNEEKVQSVPAAASRNVSPKTRRRRSIDNGLAENDRSAQ